MPQNSLARQIFTRSAATNVCSTTMGSNNFWRSISINFGTITLAKRWARGRVGGVRKLQFLLIYSTMWVGWPKSQKSKKTSWHNTWMGSPCSLCYILVRILKVSTSLGIKGQTIIFSRWHNRANKFNSTTCRLVFVRFLEESEDTKKTSRN